MARLNDWHSRLSAVIDASRDRPFEWGEHDCLSWVAACLEAVTGEKPRPDMAGGYKTAAGAMRHLRRNGFASTDELVSSVLGEPVLAVFARPGDVVCADLNQLGIGAVEEAGLGRSFGICNGRLSFFVGERGLIALPTLKLEQAYRG